MYTPAENISPSSDNTHITLSENTHNTLSENAHNNLSENTQNTHTTTDTGSSSLLWKKVGDVFITQPNAPVNITQEGTSLVNTHIKRSPILCMRSVSATYDSEPRQYFASKEALFDLLSEKWKQVELVLNPTTLETYTDSSCLWPKKKLEVNVNLTGPSKPERLELFLLSPLDYTFCIRYRSTSRKDPMIVTLTFKARSFIQCQEWYMAIYDRLPATSKHPPPKSCEVYIPLIGISISIPLVHLQKYEEVTIESVKEATLTVLEDAQSEDQAFNQKLARILKADNKQWGLCWTINDRVEWVYWTHSTSIPGKRIDLVVCPQSIEHTHRLELREIEHAPGKILLDDTHLEEPLPVEGYLRRLTDFRGLRHRLFKPKYCYLATFDRYLFYSPSSKVESPNLSCIRKEGFPNDIKYTQSACIVSPFIGQSITEDITSAEIDRRMQLIISSTCMVDLTEVSYITRRFTEDEDQDTNDSRISSHSTSTPMLFRQNNSKKNKPFLEIVMNSGVQIKFEVS
ncbi:hypothetical protein BDB01DRAFT_715018 [Pilobolus umbonatus]|nr:hypothetical protein BDB01DRAFT_715018 [Pilobolus umbonatus]